MLLRHFVDLADRFILLCGGIAFWWHFAPAALVHPQYFLMMLETGFVCIMTTIRPFGRPFATRLWPIVIALLAGNLLMWVRPEGYNPGGATLGGILIFVGFAFSSCAKIALNRRFSILPAAISVQDKGPYALIRHPVYAGYFVTYLGFLITNPTIWNFSIYVLAVICQILRINEEEKVLDLDPKYEAYQRKVRFRLVPGVY